MGLELEAADTHKPCRSLINQQRRSVGARACATRLSMRLLLLLLRRQSCPLSTYLTPTITPAAATQHSSQLVRACAPSLGRALSAGGEASSQQRGVQQQQPAAEVSSVSADGAASPAAAAATAAEATAQERASAGTDHPGAALSSVATQLVRPGLLAEFSGTLNRLTGYEGIDHLKGRVADVDASLTAAKQQLSAAKREYDTQLGQQVQLHREVTALLQRKSAWVPADVARFTELYAAEHANEQAVAAAKARYSALGDEVDTLQLRLVDLIRERYQQEQLWSDKIRRASTWWTWGLMGLHFASFMAVYTFIEPRKRAALTAAVAGMLQQHTASLDSKLAHLAAPGSAAAAAAGRSGTQQQQQQQQSPDAGPQLQQQVLAELQKVQHQLQALQQQLPQHAQAAATAAAEGAGAAVKAEAQAAASLRQWHVPGSAWASRQLAAAGSLAHQSWTVTRDKAQDVAAHFRVLQELAAHGKQPPQQQPEKAPAGVVPVATVVASDSSRQDQQQPRTPQKQQQQEDRAAPQPSSSGLGVAGLWQQLRAGSSVVHITKGQLAAVGAAASAAGAGLAAVVLLALSGGRGGAAS